MPPSPSPTGLTSKYLRVQDLRRLERFSFTGRRRVEGLYAGNHPTRQRGQSIEFHDYRQYMPGDEVANVDWKVYGRSDRLYLKLFEHQAQWTVNLVVDASHSMGYRGQADAGERTGRREPPDSKYDYACRLAAAIAFLVVRQQDRASFALARHGLAGFLPSVSTMPQLAGLLRRMEGVRALGEANLAAALSELMSRTGRRELFVIVSDLLDDRDEILKALSVCLHRGGEVLVFHVLHPDELSLPEIEHGVFVDSESGASIRLSVDDVRPAYAARIKEFLDGWSAACRGMGIDYRLCSTAVPYYQALEHYLAGRAGRRG